MAVVELTKTGRVAHHFDSAQQQFDAGKLGMWLFLVTEVLFFSGLFVAYAVYRSNHPEVFVNAHKYLNTTLGALNTVVLLISSLTMAWAVRSAQLNQRRALVGLLATTLSCASLFLGVKAVEYSHKWNQGLLWAGRFAAHGDGSHEAISIAAKHHGTAGALPATFHWSGALTILSGPFAIGALVSLCMFGVACKLRRVPQSRFWMCMLVASLAYFGGVLVGEAVESYSHHPSARESTEQRTTEERADAAKTAQLTGVFFSIYYAMTGVHALHILVGIGVIAWLLLRATRNEFGSDYFGPVDFVALYWHLVDLVWIYLFPLLYLIR